ncbi:MAG TPA: 2Fe-2S iron-sulfur cluster-binding protein, partial [Sphingomicrobium sp.]
MPTVWATTRGGETRQIEARSGVSLKENLKRGGMDEILGICGGCASCGTCHVYVAEDWVGCLPPIEPDEETVFTKAVQVFGS